MKVSELCKMFRTSWFLLVILVSVRTEPQPEHDLTNSEPTKGIHAAHDDKSKSLRNGGALHPVRCYSCTDCDRVFHNTTVKVCPYDPDSSKMHKCVTYVEKYKYLGKPWYIRGCASERGTCAEIRKAHDGINDGVMTLSSCHECEGERCNGVSRSLPIAFLTLLVTPILAKLALS